MGLHLETSCIYEYGRKSSKKACGLSLGLFTSDPSFLQAYSGSLLPYYLNFSVMWTGFGHLNARNNMCYSLLGKSFSESVICHVFFLLIMEVYVKMTLHHPELS